MHACRDARILDGMRLIWTLLLSGMPVWAAAQSLDAPEPLRQLELVRLVRQDCGACHGMNLTGGLGLSLLPQDLRDKPIDSLVATVLYGRPGTPMPAWKTILGEKEVEWIVAQLIKGFPQE